MTDGLNSKQVKVNFQMFVIQIPSATGLPIQVNPKASKMKGVGARVLITFYPNVLPGNLSLGLGS